MDPFTIVTGSAGLLSTSITVCSGLISYCRSYRSREEDLSGLRKNAEQLKIRLQLLESRTRPVPSSNQDCKDALNECIAACGKCLDELGQLSDKYSPPSTGSASQSRHQLLRRKICYPFQKPRFESFKQQINGLNILLLGSMAVLNYDVNTTMRDESRKQAKDLALLIFDGTEGLKSHIDTALPGLSRQLDTELSQRAQGAITLRLDDFQSRLENLIKDTLKSLQPMSQPALLIDTLEMTENSTSTGPSLDIPSTQETCLAPESHSTASKVAELQNSTSLTPVSKSCNYLAVTRRPQDRRRPRCHTQLRQNRKSITGCLRIFSYLVQAGITIEYSQRAFLHELHIQPNFTIRATVPSDSSAFRLIGGIAKNVERDNYSSAGELQEQVRICLRDLKDLFSSGQAWPTDVDVYGRTLMNEACCLDFYNLKPKMQVVPVYLDFLEGLFHLGIPLGQFQSMIGNWLSHFEFDEVVSLEDFFGLRENKVIVFMRGLVKTLAYLGADLWDTDTTIVNPGPYFFKVLGKDMLGQNHREGAVGSNPLHVSTPWPQGMRLIFELGGEVTRNIIHTKDTGGATALDYAIRLGEINSVKQLVTHGHAVIHLEPGIGQALFRLQRPSRSREEFSFLAQILADRRRQLYHFATYAYESFERLELRMEPSTASGALILQEDAFDVVAKLPRVGAAGINVPQVFRDIPPGSIYHSLSAPPVGLLEALYQAGFSHTNVTYFGFCPLMTNMFLPEHYYELARLPKTEGAINLLEVTVWFQQHGADLNRLIPQSAISGSRAHHDETRQFRLVHQLSRQLGYFLEWERTRCYAMPDEVSSMLREIISSQEVDPCTCFCSSKGCTTVSLLARRRPRKGMLEAFGVVETLDPGSEVELRVNSDLLRLMTFEKLGMRHTCCKYVYSDYENPLVSISNGQFRCLKLMDPDEIVEIQEEEAALSLLLEDLVSDFEDQYRSLRIPFWDFHRDHWLPRMSEVDDEKKDLSPEEKDALRGIGVILHDTRESDAA